MKTFFELFKIFGVLTIALAQVSMIGYFLYLWGAAGISVGESAWNAFLLWGSMVLISMALFLIYIFGGVLYENRGKNERTTTTSLN